MAIIIPSKSIYKKDNPKVRDNLVDKIEVSAVEITPSNDYDITVFNEEFDVKPIPSSSFRNIAKNYQDSINNQKTYIIFGLIRLVPYYNSLNVNIIKSKNNKYLQYLYLGKDKENNDEIGVNIHYNKFLGNSSTKLRIIDNVVYETSYQYDRNSTSSETGNTKKFEPKLKHEYRYYGVSYVDYKVEIQDFINETNLNGDIEYYEDEEKISFKVNILSGYDIITMDGMQVVPLYSVSNTDWFEITGKGESYIADSITITVNGDTIGIDLTNKTITIGEGGKPLSFEGNELMQTTNRLNTPINGKSSAIEDLYTSTLNSFRNGKETATIRCSITNYYRYNDDSYVEIDTASDSRKYFKDGMQVVPMVFGADGKDKPMSYYSDGTAKVFNVLSNKIVDDGVPMQELTLQEADK